MPRFSRELDADTATETQVTKWNKWLKKGFECSIYDLCEDCSEEMDGEPCPEELKPCNEEPKDVPTVMRNGVEHPCYDDDDFCCAICCILLMQEYDA